MAGRPNFTGRRGARSDRSAARCAALALVALAVAGCGSSTNAIPSPARLALVYRSGGRYLLATPTGRDRRPLGTGSQALLSPDGTRVLVASARSSATRLMLYGTARRPSARALAALAAPQFSAGSVHLLAWSADSRYVALTADEVGRTGVSSLLLVLDTHSGRLIRVAAGNFLGAAFSPTEPDRLVYAAATIAQLDNNESLLYESAVTGGRDRRLTRSGFASAPAWGARGIVFAKLMRLGSRSSAPLYGLWQIGPDGGRAQRITAFAAGPPKVASDGSAISISANGERLVADFYSEGSGRSSTVWAVRLGVHAQTRALSVPGAIIAAASISRAGRTILLTTRAPNGTTAIESLSWSGAKPRVLAGAGTNPSWNS